MGCLHLQCLFYCCALSCWWGRSSKSLPAVAASCTLIRTSCFDVAAGSSVSFHGSSNLNEVALEAAPVGEATHWGDCGSATAVVTTKGEAAGRAACIGFVSPSFALGVLSGCFSEHNAGGDVKKGFNDLLDLAAEVSSGASSRQHLANLLEDLGNHVPEDKWVSNIFPLFFVSGGCNRQVCNVAVLAASCVPAKGAVSAATAQSLWNSNAVRAADSIKDGVIEAVQAVFAACSVARQRAGQAAGTSAEERVASSAVK